MDPKLRELSSCRLQKAKQNLEVASGCGFWSIMRMKGVAGK